MIEVLFFLLFSIFVLFSIIIHEYVHGFTAYRLGDPTPKIANRLTLNPLAHIDIFGTVILPLTTILATSALGHPVPIGYAKPMPINPFNFKNPKKDIALVGLSGPLSNLLIAIILAILIKIPLPDFLVSLFFYTIFANLILFILNIFPIPPLDGSRIFAYFLPYKISTKYLKMKFLMVFLIIFIVFFPFINNLVYPLLRFLLKILGVSGIIV